MKKIIYTFLLILITYSIHAQTPTLMNTNWKGYFADPLNDTITFHFSSDSSYGTSTNGTLLVKSSIKYSRDSIFITDVSGIYACPFNTGVYRYSIKDNILTLTLVTDPCEGRNEITNIIWRRQE